MIYIYPIFRSLGIRVVCEGYIFLLSIGDKNIFGQKIKILEFRIIGKERMDPLIFKGRTFVDIDLFTIIIKLKQYILSNG